MDQLQAFCNSTDDEMPVPVKLLHQRKMSLKAIVNHNPNVLNPPLRPLYITHLVKTLTCWQSPYSDQLPAPGKLWASESRLGYIYQNVLYFIHWGLCRYTGYVSVVLCANTYYLWICPIRLQKRIYQKLKEDFFLNIIQSTVWDLIKPWYNKKLNDNNVWLCRNHCTLYSLQASLKYFGFQLC